MIISRQALKAAAVACDPAQNRYFSAAVFVTPADGVQATDGHLAVKVADRSPFPDADFPVVDGVPELATPTANVPIAVDTLDRLIKATAKRSPVPILSSIRVGESADGQRYAVATDLQAPMVAKVAPVADGPTLPALDRVWLKADVPVVRVCIAGPMLARLAKIAAAVHDNAKGNQTITLSIPIPLVVDSPDERPEVDRVRLAAGCDTAIGFTVNGREVTASGVFMGCRE